MSIIKDLHAQLEVFESDAKEEIKRFLEFVGLRVPDAVVEAAPIAPEPVEAAPEVPEPAEQPVNPPEDKA
jgi:hypothetical protein